MAARGPSCRSRRLQVTDKWLAANSTAARIVRAVAKANNLLRTDRPAALGVLADALSEPGRPDAGRDLGRRAQRFHARHLAGPVPDGDGYRAAVGNGEGCCAVRRGRVATEFASCGSSSARSLRRTVHDNDRDRQSRCGKRAQCLGLAPRLRGLDSRRIALIDNSKHHADEFLAEVKRLLTTQCGVTEFARLSQVERQHPDACRRTRRCRRPL